METTISTQSKSKAQRFISELLSKAGVQVNGPNSWDIQVHNEGFYGRLINQGSLGLGESFMDGWWSAEKLDQFFYRILEAKLYQYVKPSFQNLVLGLRSYFQNQQSRNRSKKVAWQHYDLGNEFYTSFLDPYNQYTCGYFNGTHDLDLAQEQKLEMICRKLKLSETDRVLDIGCGWGGFAKYAAEHFGCSVDGITISESQYDYAREYCKNLPVTIRKMDYRDLSDQYDKVLVCGMIEHVGYKNYRRLVEIVFRNLKDKGLFLLHTIGGNTSLTYADPWITKYIFPNSLIPSAKQLTSAFEGLLTIEDWHNFGLHYVPTLKAWFQNFNKNWSQFKDQYGDRFYRMFKYYLLSSAGAFQARELQLWQIVLSKGWKENYVTIR